MSPTCASSFDVKGCCALVTGANRPDGIGRKIVLDLLDAGAQRVYATSRNVAELEDLQHEHDGRVVAVELDVMDVDSVKTLPSKCDDVTLIVNNAGYMAKTGPLDDLEAAHREMEVNYMGPMSVVSVMAPLLKSKTCDKDNVKATAVVNIDSIASFVSMPAGGTYSASKAAEHSLTQAQRRDLPDSLVIGVYPGPIDTDMTKDADVEKSSVDDVSSSILEALRNGTEEVFPDDKSKELFQKWKDDFKKLEKDMAETGRKTSEREDSSSGETTEPQETDETHTESRDAENTKNGAGRKWLEDVEEEDEEENDDDDEINEKKKEKDDVEDEKNKEGETAAGQKNVETTSEGQKNDTKREQSTKKNEQVDTASEPKGVENVNDTEKGESPADGTTEKDVNAESGESASTKKDHEQQGEDMTAEAENTESGDDDDKPAKTRIDEATEESTDKDNEPQVDDVVGPGQADAKVAGNSEEGDSLIFAAMKGIANVFFPVETSADPNDVEVTDNNKLDDSSVDEPTEMAEKEDDDGISSDPGDAKDGGSGEAGKSVTVEAAEGDDKPQEKDDTNADPNDVGVAASDESDDTPANEAKVEKTEDSESQEKDAIGTEPVDAASADDEKAGNSAVEAEKDEPHDADKIGAEVTDGDDSTTEEEEKPQETQEMSADPNEVEGTDNNILDAPSVDESTDETTEHDKESKEKNSTGAEPVTDADEESAGELSVNEADEDEPHEEDKIGAEPMDADGSTREEDKKPQEKGELSADPNEVEDADNNKVDALPTKESTDEITEKNNETQEKDEMGAEPVADADDEKLDESSDEEAQKDQPREKDDIGAETTDADVSDDIESGESPVGEAMEMSLEPPQNENEIRAAPVDAKGTDKSRTAGLSVDEAADKFMKNDVESLTEGKLSGEPTDDSATGNSKTHNSPADEGADELAENDGEAQVNDELEVETVDTAAAEDSLCQATEKDNHPNNDETNATPKAEVEDDRKLNSPVDERLANNNKAKIADDDDNGTSAAAKEAENADTGIDEAEKRTNDTAASASEIDSVESPTDKHESSEISGSKETSRDAEPQESESKTAEAQ